MMASREWLDLATATQPSVTPTAPPDVATPSSQIAGPAALVPVAGLNEALLSAEAASGQSFDYAVQFSDPNNYAGSLVPAIEADMNAALQGFEGKVYGAGTLVVELDIISSNPFTAGELANGGPAGLAPQGNQDGRVLETPSSIYELRTGSHLSGYQSDIVVQIPSSALGELYFDPNPAAGDSIASVAPSEYDAITVFRHEVTHGLGFISLRDTQTGTLASVETEFDHYSSITSTGADFFTGPGAEAVYGGPIPVTTLHNGEQYSHLGNDPGGPLASDLMGGTGLMNGVTHQVSSLDFAILGDIGVPETGLPCFAEGTSIALIEGEVPVEALRPGDKVLLARGGSAAIRWIGRKTIDIAAHPEPERVAPIVITAGSVAEGVPVRDLVLSPDHALFFDGRLIPAKVLLNGASVRQVHPSAVTYYHVELEAHDVILAEGLAAESYLDTGNRAAFGSGGVPRSFALAAQEDARLRGSCAPLIESGPAVEAIRSRLLDRAAIATTANPSLRIIAGPTVLPTVIAAPEMIEVALPAEPHDIVIRSRRFVPGETGTDPRDRRCLGIAVSAIELGDETGWRIGSLADPALNEGWHAKEGGHRWTNGRGIIPARFLAGATRLRVRFQAANRYRRAT